MISQKDAVFQTVCAFLEENDRKYEEGVKVELSRDDRKTCVTMLIAFTEAGEVEVKSEKARADLKDYWNGCVSNHLRKDLRLNGNVEHVIKNPGSRAGSGDAELKEMKKLLIKVKGTEHEEVVQKAIDDRLKVIAEEKMKDLEINEDNLPENLKHLAG